MEYTYATLLLHETGAELNQANLTAVLEAGGCTVEESRVKALVAALEDVDLDALPQADAEAVAAQVSAETTAATQATPDATDEPSQSSTEPTETGG